MPRFDRWMYASLILLLAASLARAEQARLPIPSADEQAAARPTVSQLFADELSKNRPEDDIDVAKKLIDRSYQRPISAAELYLVLIESRNLAVAGRDLNTADIACWELSQNFAVSLTAARVEMLQSAAAVMVSKEESASLVSASLRAIDDALRHDEFEAVDQLMKLANEALRTAASPDLARALSVRKGQLTLQRAEYKRVAPQMAELAANPNDPAANLAVGKYICFIRGDWPTGLALLIKGSDEHLKDLAHLDRSNPADPDVQESLADQWYGLGNLPTIKGDQVRLRAYYWYEKISEGLGDDAPAKVKTRIRELQPLLARRQTSGELWSAIGKALRNKSYARSDIVGGGGARKDFEDIPAAGAVLIGIRVGKGTFDNYPTVISFQGIYLTADGQEVLGKTAGTPKSDPITLKARPGYAVGAIQARGGAGMDALTLTFMRINGNHLDPTTAYRSDKVGGVGGQEMDFDGKGMPMIGLCGRTDPQWIGFGVVYLADVDGKRR